MSLNVLTDCSVLHRVLGLRWTRVAALCQKIEICRERMPSCIMSSSVFLPSSMPMVHPEEYMTVI